PRAVVSPRDRRAALRALGARCRCHALFLLLPRPVFPGAGRRTTMRERRDRMEADLRLRRRSANTCVVDLRCVRAFAAYQHRSSAELGEPEVRAFLTHLVEERRVRPSTQGVYAAALRVLYALTLRRPDISTLIPRPPVVRSLPAVLGPRGGRAPDRGRVVGEIPGALHHRLWGRAPRERVGHARGRGHRRRPPDAAHPRRQERPRPRRPAQRASARRPERVLARGPSPGTYLFQGTGRGTRSRP